MPPLCYPRPSESAAPPEPRTFGTSDQRSVYNVRRRMHVPRLTPTKRFNSTLDAKLPGRMARKGLATRHQVALLSTGRA